MAEAFCRHCRKYLGYVSLLDVGWKIEVLDKAHARKCKKRPKQRKTRKN